MSETTVTDTRIIAQLGESDIAALIFRTELFNNSFVYTSSGNERSVEQNFLPDQVLHDHFDPDGDRQIVGWHQGVLVTTRFYKNSQSMWFKVAGADRELVSTIYQHISNSMVPPKIEDNKISINFWVMTANGPECHVRDLECPKWEQVKDNYAPQVHEAYARTLELYPNDTAGNIIVWHGPPGTGKTSAIRTLMQSLKEVSEFHYIVDPEKFYGDDPSYLIQVLLNSRQNRDHRMFILEDTGEMLHADAKNHVGQALSRLLNTADGLIGQGTGVKMLMTTNDPITTLHPAIVRPGRCLSEVKFDKLPAHHANQWLKSHEIDETVTEPVTLGELYAMKGEYLQKEIKEETSTGMYM